MNKPRIDISPDPDSLATKLAEWMVEQTLATTGSFSFNLSGGSTPKRLYSLLASQAFRPRIDWARIRIFFGDERFVPMDHPDSNYRMAREAMLDHVPIPADNIFPVPTQSGSPDDAAAAYEDTLKRFYGKETIDLPRPLFDLTLLGLGEDGHTASLFPGTAALAERQRWVTSVIGAKPEPRITMTYPVLASSASVVLLVAGAGKKEVLKRVLDRDPDLPASRIEPQGEFVIFCDEAAAP